MNPRLTYTFVSATVLAFAATALVISTDPAVAEEANDTMEELVVEAPFSIRQVERGAFGATTELIELKRHVSIADLDLSKHADVIELETRVEAVSTESCDQLSDMFPLDLPSAKRSCIKKAIQSAEEQMQAAIVAAN